MQQNIASQADDIGCSSCFVKLRIEVCRLYCRLKKIDDSRFLKRIFNWSSSNGKCFTKHIVKFNLVHPKLISKVEERWKF